LPKEAIVLLTTICNVMLRLSYFPTIWKFAQITMIPKPGDHLNEVASYLPTSLLLILSKPFETLFFNGLKNDTKLQDLIPDYQFGFREHHSTIRKIHRTVNKIAVSLEKNNSAQRRFWILPRHLIKSGTLDFYIKSKANCRVHTICC
jgi:hypothetical protein